jgi:putative DNA primase/helicase
LLFAISLALNGQQGSAKSTTARIFRMVVDPAARRYELMELPEDTRDLWLLPKQMHLLPFDNVSKVTLKQSDVLCKIVYGNSNVTRLCCTNLSEELRMK